MGDWQKTAQDGKEMQDEGHGTVYQPAPTFDTHRDLHKQTNNSDCLWR